MVGTYLFSPTIGSLSFQKRGNLACAYFLCIFHFSLLIFTPLKIQAEELQSLEQVQDFFLEPFVHAQSNSLVRYRFRKEPPPDFNLNEVDSSTIFNSAKAKLSKSLLRGGLYSIGAYRNGSMIISNNQVAVIRLSGANKNYDLFRVSSFSQNGALNMRYELLPASDLTKKVEPRLRITSSVLASQRTVYVENLDDRVYQASVGIGDFLPLSEDMDEWFVSFVEAKELYAPILRRVDSRYEISSSKNPIEDFDKPMEGQTNKTLVLGECRFKTGSKKFSKVNCQGCDVLGQAGPRDLTYDPRYDIERRPILIYKLLARFPLRPVAIVYYAIDAEELLPFFKLSFSDPKTLLGAQQYSWGFTSDDILVLEDIFSVEPKSLTSFKANLESFMTGELDTCVD